MFALWSNLKPGTYRSDVKCCRMLYRETFALDLNSMKGHRNINMMRTCDCSWLLPSNMLITRLHRLPSERAYQGVQLFSSASATGNDGWGCNPGMERRCVCGLSFSAFQWFGNEMSRQITSMKTFIRWCKNVLWFPLVHKNQISWQLQAWLFYNLVMLH